MTDEATRITRERLREQYRGRHSKPQEAKPQGILRGQCYRGENQLRAFRSRLRRRENEGFKRI
jgi:hypothetical protein